MATLIVTVFAGVLFGYFATLNTNLVSVSFGNLMATVPLYLIVLGSLLLGLLISGVINLVDTIGAGLTIRSRERKIEEGNKEVASLRARIDELEIKNAELKERGRNYHSETEHIDARPRTPLEKLRDRVFA